MPVFNNHPSRATYRLLVTFFLMTTAPLLNYFFFLAINSDLPGETRLEDPLKLKIPVIVVCSLWILYVMCGAATRRDWPLSRWGDAADLCRYLCPVMLVILVSFCLSAFLPDADLLPENDESALPPSMIPLFGLSVIGMCASCCLLTKPISGNRDGRLFECWLCCLSLALLFFFIFLGFKTSNTMETIEFSGQAALVEKKYTWFSTFFPTILIDILVFPCAISRLKIKWQSRNVSETETAKCTAWFFFVTGWFATLIVRYMFVYDEYHLWETWDLIPGGKNTTTTSSNNPNNHAPPIINLFFGQNEFNQLTSFGNNQASYDGLILPEHVDAEFLRCGKSVSSTPGTQRFFIDFSIYRTYTKNVSYLSIWGICSNYCYNSKYFSINPEYRNSGPYYPSPSNQWDPQKKYVCKCSNSFSSNNLATPSFDCIDPSSGRMAGRWDCGNDPSNCVYNSRSSTFMQFQTYPYEACTTYPTQSSSIAAVSSIGACSNACVSKYDDNEWRNAAARFGLSGRECHCFPNGMPDNVNSKPKSYCEEIVSFSSTVSSSYPPLKELRGVHKKFMVFFKHLPKYDPDYGKTYTKLGSNNSLNLGMPSVFNMTEAQINPMNNIGKLPILNDSQPVDLGPIVPGGEFVVQEFNPPDITYTIATNTICTNRASLNGLYGKYGSTNDYNNDFYTPYSYTLKDAKMLCTDSCIGVMEYLPISPLDVSSFYFCYDYQCPLVVGGSVSNGTQIGLPIVHIRTDVPLKNVSWSQNAFPNSQYSTPQCIQYNRHDTVKMTYVEHYIPIMVFWCFLALTLVVSLLRYPVTSVAGSAYQTFDAERRRRERERLRQIDLERKEMEEARRIGREIGQQHDDWSTTPLIPTETESGETKKADDKSSYEPPQTPSAPLLDPSTISPSFTTQRQTDLTPQEQFMSMLDEFSVARDPSYMISVLNSLKDLFRESPELRQESTTKNILIQRAKTKRKEDSDCWTEDVAKAFGSCLKSLSLLSRLGIDVNLTTNHNNNAEGGNVIANSINTIRDGLINS